MDSCSIGKSGLFQKIHGIYNNTLRRQVDEKLNFLQFFLSFFCKLLDDFFRIGTLLLFCSNFKKSCNKNWKKIDIQYCLLQTLYILGWVQALKLENKTRIYCFLLPDSISSPALQKRKASQPSKRPSKAVTSSVDCYQEIPLSLWLKYEPSK